MRRVFAVVEHDGQRRWDSVSNSVYLLFGAIFVLSSLQDQDRAADGIEARFDVPITKTWIEPNVVPAPEQRIYIRVIPA